jgi:hypothetical protein
MPLFRLLLVACLVMGTLWAANDPFVSKWKVNPSKSKLTDEMKVEAVGANKYAITFGPGAVDTIVADGTDQPSPRGTTLSITVEGPTTGRSSARGKAARSSLRTGHFPRTAKRSTTTTRVTRPTVRR